MSNNMKTAYLRCKPNTVKPKISKLDITPYFKMAF